VQSAVSNLKPGNEAMSKTKISQGPWTRIRPLQRDEVDPHTSAAISNADITWGIRNNLAKVMAYMPRMTQTAIDYVNSFIFDPPTYRGDVHESAFNDRFLKELVISRTSLYNRSRYAVTHHAFIGMALFSEANRAEEGHRKYLHLHEHERHPDVYTERERLALDYAIKVAADAHLVTDDEFEALRRVLREHNDSDERLSALSPDAKSAHVDAQIVELTWLIGHFCLLNRWFTALQVPDETSADEDDFLAAYAQVVPEDIRKRNEALLGGDF
jgi:alkylhydroperoxidase family enzyme